MVGVGVWWSQAGVSRSNHVATQDHNLDHTVQLVTADGEQAIPLGQPVVTHGDEHAELLLDRQHKVVMNADTTATVDVEGEAFTINLARGELYVEVVPGHAFEVTTPHARLTITGTKFNVKTDPSQTELALLKGSVRFASLANEQTVDVTTGHASTVAGRLAPTTPRQVDAQMVTAWARQKLPGVPETGEVASYPGDGAALLGEIPLTALMPEIPDYRTWSYERFRDEMRPWFAEQFPWAMELEKALNEEYGIEADYLDVLVISGDIWQFRYPVGMAENIAAFHPTTLHNLAGWYGLDPDQVAANIGRQPEKSSLGMLSDGRPLGEQFAEALYLWQDGWPQESQADAAIFSFHAMGYLVRTRSALYCWVKEHPVQAERLWADPDYPGVGLTGLEASVDGESVLQKLDVQLMASRKEYERTTNLLFCIVKGKGDDCIDKSN